MTADCIRRVIKNFERLQIVQEEIVANLCQLEQDIASSEPNQTTLPPAWLSLKLNTSASTVQQPSIIPCKPVTVTASSTQNPSMVSVVQQVPYMGNFEIGDRVRVTNCINKKSGKVTERD